MVSNEEVYQIIKRIAVARKALDRANTSEENKIKIRDFANYLLASGFSKARVARYLGNLKRISVWLEKDFSVASKEDLMNVVRKVQEMDLADWTKHGYKVMLRRFYQWMHDCREDEYPDIVRWIDVRTKLHNRKLVTSDGLITEEDVIKIVDVCDNIRNKAFIYVLWDSGARIGELACADIRNVVFDKFGAVLYIEKGKTGGRPIRLVNSAPYLSAWLSVHPRRNEKDAPLWVSLTCREKGKALKYNSIGLLLRRAFGVAKIMKRCNPHFFRHSRATSMASDLNEFQLCQVFGWQLGSDMPKTYLHLSRKYTESAVLKMHGIEQPEEKDKKFNPEYCRYCGALNPPKIEKCMKCGMNIRTAVESPEVKENDKAVESQQSKEEMVARLLKDSDFVKLVVDKLDVRS